MLGAADTFRAAAVEQLSIWSERADVPIIKHKEGADPAAVAYDATEAACSRKMDNLLIDTAGRLHTKVNLMEELKKVQRVVGKRLVGAPHEVLLVLDATTGQNALQQARVFTEALSVTGLVITKLDGTAKGGVALAIQKQLGIPIKYIGVGEALEDLQPFDPEAFVSALFN
jgi:fused signal recognition particle receptor